MLKMRLNEEVIWLVSLKERLVENLRQMHGREEIDVVKVFGITEERRDELVGVLTDKWLKEGILTKGVEGALMEARDEGEVLFVVFLFGRAVEMMVGGEVGWF